MKIIAVKIKGSKKCSVKNRVNVGLSTENPPHNHDTKFVPIYGIAENKLVITVAPQNDICPQGSTYPKNAVAIKINKISTPVIHTIIDLYEP